MQTVDLVVGAAVEQEFFGGWASRLGLFQALQIALSSASGGVPGMLCKACGTEKMLSSLDQPAGRKGTSLYSLRLGRHPSDVTCKGKLSRASDLSSISTLSDDNAPGDPSGSDPHSGPEAGLLRPQVCPSLPGGSPQQ